ncbi:MAG: L,D-transpeptidase [Akkermansiaceae bacterium]|nr:L,D-transpeptidase [Akkermansiaceae bacterium]
MKYISISIGEEKIRLLDNERVVAEYTISSAANGIGFDEGSYCTPTGRFVIQEKIGEGEPLHTIFKSRLSVGIWDGEITTDDMILTRILRLHGLDPENANSMKRFIYIHGTNREDMLGQPASCGCIRMSNADIIELFDAIDLRTPVFIG